MRQLGLSSVIRSAEVAAIICAISGIVLFPSTSSAQSNPIVLENQQTGTTDWDIQSERVGTDATGQIKGYASATSINRGESITFHVSVNPAQTYTMDVYRVGWYQGLGGRLIQHIGPLSGVKQPACPMDVTTGLRECNWAPAYTLTTQTSWTTGIYLVVLTNAANYQNYIMFVVRDDSRVGALLYQQPVTTYQAYNDYPNDNTTGKSLYDYNSYGANTVGGSKAAVKVSFDRPDANTGISDDFRSWEIHFIRWMEKSGYDVTYSTNVDTHANGGRLLNTRGFLSVGHDEYWSRSMFDAAVAARDAGVSLGFFGGNAIYWQARFEPSGSGVPNRVLVCYRADFLDPVSDPNLKTVLWRDPPVNRPEQTLIGVQFVNMVSWIPGPVSYPAHVVKNSGHWAYAGTGFADGNTVPGIVGYEADRLFSEYPGPNTVSGTYTLLSHSPFNSNADYSNSSIYQAPSGAWVFGAGTIFWSWGLDSYGAGWNIADARLQRMTANILDRFIASGQRDFFLGSSPSSRTVTPGAPATYDITISPSGGFTDEVTLSVSGLPSGANAGFSQNPSTAASMLSITTSSSTPVGTYPLTITGVSGSLTHTTTATLIVLVPDFTLAASPSSRTVTAGGSTTYSVTVSLVGGFTGPVDLSVSGLPAGANAGFAPNPATSASTLSVTTTSGTSAGTYPLIITGVSGGLTHTTPVSLVVTVPDFALTASPQTRSIAIGASTTYTFTITPSGGFTGSVALSVAGLPANSTASFAPNPVTSTSTMSVTTSASTPVGTSTLTVTGASGSITHSATVALTVTSGITVTAPNTAVSWKATSNQNITFTHNLGVGQAVNIDVSRDAGSSWSTITTFATTSATTGTYSWKVSGPPTTQARIRVTATANPLASDSSDVNFTITNPVITVTAPNTAVSWRTGDTKSITFSHDMGVGQTVNIQVSRDSGVTWAPVGPFTTTSATSGTYPWVVSGPPSQQARIRVSWSADASVTDISNVNFTILPRTTVTAPNTAVTYGAGSTRTVTWTHNLGMGGAVNIDFSPDNGATWAPLALGVPSSAATTGTYSVPMPATVTTQALIRVSPTVDPPSGDISDVPFTLATPTISVTAPNTNVLWAIGSAQSIKWSHNLGILESVKIELARDGVNYTELITPSAINSANTSGTFTWVVTGPATTTAKARVTSVSNGAVTDTGNVNFRIQ